MGGEIPEDALTIERAAPIAVGGAIEIPVVGANQVIPVVGANQNIPVVGAINVDPVVGPGVSRDSRRRIEGRRSDYDCTRCLQNGHNRHECDRQNTRRRYTNSSLERRRLKEIQKNHARQATFNEHLARGLNMPAPPALHPYEN